jgi:hypothetical protein
MRQFIQFKLYNFNCGVRDADDDVAQAASQEAQEEEAQGASQVLDFREHRCGLGHDDGSCPRGPDDERGAVYPAVLRFELAAARAAHHDGAAHLDPPYLDHPLRAGRVLAA